VASTIRASALAALAVPAAAATLPGIVLRQRHPLTVLDLRGPANAAFRDAVWRICGCELPLAPNSSTASAMGEILKLGPNEWLLVADAGTAWSETLPIPAATLTDVSHARVAVQVAGRSSREMLAKGCAVDLHPRECPPGTCIQTSVAEINVIVHKQHSDTGFTVYAARSYAACFWRWLITAASEYGYHVVAP
jgi:sarcosine oxidase subunit gamma